MEYHREVTCRIISQSWIPPQTSLPWSVSFYWLQTISSNNIAQNTTPTNSRLVLQHGTAWAPTTLLPASCGLHGSVPGTASCFREYTHTHTCTYTWNTQWSNRIMCINNTKHSVWCYSESVWCVCVCSMLSRGRWVGTDCLQSIM